MSYGNSIFNVSASIFRYQCFDIGLGAILVEIIMQNLANSGNIFDKEFSIIWSCDLYSIESWIWPQW